MDLEEGVLLVGLNSHSSFLTYQVVVVVTHLEIVKEPSSVSIYRSKIPKKLQHDSL